MVFEHVIGFKSVLVVNYFVFFKTMCRILIINAFRYLCTKFSTMITDIIERLKWRYATKKFDQTKTLEPEQVNLLKEAFNLTATSYGLQTLKMLVIKDKDVRNKLLEHAYGQRQVLDSSHLLVLCVQKVIGSADVDAHFDNVSATRSVPETILAPYRASLKSVIEDMTPEQKEEWSIRQAYIALGNLMTVCAMARIDSCPMEGFDVQGFDEVLKLCDDNLAPVLLLPVGYRSHDDMFSGFKKVRKQLEDTVVDWQ